ncbi:fungal-specific transcription factor domain-containing protein [Aspergillus avenaceus]|uniref:Fungal-specific transcription factor domain-containing protein n=1 Tax=Aspergillus avenaceus TaxID=36643 RepID=A0A5N6U7E1_ASPAV|nr:fungal-specific transcription factor domain-containing protein [Aspergillus avenaceus]
MELQSPSRSLKVRNDSICRTCVNCRQKKVKCDGQQPSCGSCRSRNQNCTYPQDARKTASRATKSHFRSLQNRISELQGQIQALSEETRPSEASLNASQISLDDSGDRPDRRGWIGHITDPLVEHPRNSTVISPPATNQPSCSGGPEPSNTRMVAAPDNASGQRETRSSGALLKNARSRLSEDTSFTDILRDRLISFAALGRQKEATLYSTPSIFTSIDFDGIPIDTAMHLLDLHWNRQHLSYLLTYRPAIMDSLINNGPCVNKLLLNAIYLQSSLYSDRTSLRSDPKTRKQRLLSDYVDKPTMPTVVALLTCGSCLVPHGKQSAGWLFCGMGYRMITDLGYHLDMTSIPGAGFITRESAIELELRRRVYWGAYVSDKFQSLFLGRSPAMHASHGNVPPDFLDTFEEMEGWTPYIDPQALSDKQIPHYRGHPSYALSTFRCLLQLCEIASRVIDEFYSISSTKTPKSTLPQTQQSIRSQLENWKLNLPVHLQFEPGLDVTPPPHQITPYTTYWTLIIISEQAFLKHDHFGFIRDSESQEEGRRRCIEAAFKIWKLVEAYKEAFTLRRARYGISYASCCAAHVILQQTYHDKEEYIDSLRFFWHALLEFQKSCCNGLGKPLALLKSIMRRAKKVAQRINVDAADGSGDAGFRISFFSPYCKPVLTIGPWHESDDVSLLGETIFGMFMHE